MWKNIAKGSSREVGYVNYIKAKADGSQSNELSKGITKGGFTEFSSISIYLYIRRRTIAQNKDFI